VGHYGVAPSEYWHMTIGEIEQIYQARRSKMVGNMHENEYLKLVKRREESEAKGIKVM